MIISKLPPVSNSESLSPKNLILKGGTTTADNAVFTLIGVTTSNADADLFLYFGGGTIHQIFYMEYAPSSAPTTFQVFFTWSVAQLDAICLAGHRSISLKLPKNYNYRFRWDGNSVVSASAIITV